MKAIVLANSPGALVELCGISLIERLLRVLQRLGFSSVQVVGAGDDIRRSLARPSWPREKLQLHFADEVPHTDELQLLIPGQIYCDMRVLVPLVARAKATLL